VIGKGTKWCTSGSADIAYARPVVTETKHHFEAGIQDLFTKRVLISSTINTYDRIVSAKSFLTLLARSDAGSVGSSKLEMFP
jgi:hypothetical protein